MSLGKLGEFGFIEMIQQAIRTAESNRDVPHTATSEPTESVGATMEGIGDDCAVIPSGDGHSSLVVTTDMLIEGIHFLKTADPYLLGRKSLSVSLSDIAAMGACPTASFLSISLPEQVSEQWAADFIAGYTGCSAEFSTPLLGGDTTSSTGTIAINVTVLGKAENSCIKRRADAKVGDVIFVTGLLGESATGLKQLLSGNLTAAEARIHQNPMPQVAEGKWLGCRSEVHAMMDISDGIASDLCHILKASQVGADVWTEQIPHHSTVEQAVSGGEDYKLLLTASGDVADILRADFQAHFGTTLYPIGRITPAQTTDGYRISWFDHKQPINPAWEGFNHFK